MKKPIDRRGHKYGELTLLEHVSKGNGRKKSSWKCICSCGNECTVFTSDIVTGNTVSCGCVRKETTRTKRLSHGLTDTPEYRTWRKVKERCFVPETEGYEHYGGRGITMADEWKESFECFLDYMGKRPSPEHSIDRIDYNGHYVPGNCRWGTRLEQARNKRNTLFVEYKGEAISLRDLCDKLYLNFNMARRRLFKLDWTVEQLIEWHHQNTLNQSVMIQKE